MSLFQRKFVKSWRSLVKHFDTSAYAKKPVLCWQGLFCCKMYNEPEKDLNLEGYCFEMSREDLPFTKGIFFSLFRWRSCALIFVADMLSHMGTCFETCSPPTGLKICCIYDTDCYLFSRRTNTFVLPFITVLTNMRADHSPDWEDLPRSQEPAVQDRRSKFSCIFKSIQVN